MKRIITALCLVLCAVSCFAAPTITNVLVTATTGTTATIQWTTSTPSNSSLKYGTDPSLPYQNVTNPALVTNHSMTLTLLSAGPYYYVAAVSTDNAGTTQSATINFTLCGSPLTPVSGTVTNYYQYGSYTLIWVPPAGTSQPPTVCGQPVTTAVTGVLDGGASFNTQVDDASKIVPGPGQWQITVTDAGNLAPLTIYAPLSQVTQNVSAQLQTAAATGGLQACLTNTLTSQSWPSTCGSGPGGGSPGGGVGAIQYKLNSTTFGGVNITGLVKGNGTSAPTGANGTRDGTGDYQLPTFFNCTGAINCTLASNTWNFTYSGPAGSGNVNTANAYQVGCYPATGTTIGGCPNIYALSPSMSLGQINLLFASLTPGRDMVIIPPGVPQLGWTNHAPIATFDMRVGAFPIQLGGDGIACDANNTPGNVVLTAGNNQVTVGGFGSTADVGKKMTFGVKTGYLYNSPQYYWTATITAYSGGVYTLSANAPFNFNDIAWVGTDNSANLTTAFNNAGSAYSLAVPTGCRMLVTTPVPLTGQSLIGQQGIFGGFVGTYQDILQQPDAAGQGNSTSRGQRIENIGFILDSRVDTTAMSGGPLTVYDASGNPTSVPALYRPLYEHSPLANYPCGPGWVSGTCGNGVSTTTQGSAVICTPNGYAAPVVGQAIMFPYFSSIFTSTVSSTAGSCASGFTARTMANALPNTSGYSAIQAEWFTGTAFQSTTTTIPTTITYPMTINLTLSTAPVVGYESNFATHGHVKVCGIEADYMGITTTGTYQMTLRRGPTTTTGCSGTTPIAPLNISPAKNTFGSSADAPWPVTPSINAAAITSWSISGNVATFQATNAFFSGLTGVLDGFPQGSAANFFNGQPVTVLSAGLSGTQFEVNFTHANASGSDAGSFNQTTPQGASWFPGEMAGAAAISFPTANANLFANAGLVKAYLDNLFFDVTTTQNTNGTTEFYSAGNAVPYDADMSGWYGHSVMFGIVQGAASAGQHSIGPVGPTGTGNHITNFTFYGAFPFSFVDFQQSTIDKADTYSTEVSPFDGTNVGGATCIHLGYTIDEQTGFGVTTSGAVAVNAHNCEPENGSHIEGNPNAVVDTNTNTFNNDDFENAPNYFGGSFNEVKNSFVAGPVLLYGNNNNFENISGYIATYSTNIWNGTPQWYNWGENNKCSAALGGVGPSVGCGAGFVQPYWGHSIDSDVTGNHAYQNILGGMVNPSEWNTQSNLDVSPMSVGFTIDPTEDFWGAYVACNLNGSTSCQSAHFDNFGGYIFIGPQNRITDGPYVLKAHFKMATSSTYAFALNMQAEDPGGTGCSAAGVLSQVVNVTNAWQTYEFPVDFTGHAGCVLQVSFSGGGSADQLRVGKFNLVPKPAEILLPTATPTIGAACTNPNSIIGSNSTQVLACLNGVVAAIGSGSSGSAITALTQDVTATGPGSVAATVRSIGGGSPFSGWTGLMQNNAGVVSQATNAIIAGYVQAGTRVLSAVNSIASSATPVFDLSLGDTQLITLTSNVTSSSYVNAPSVNLKQRVDFIICQDATGGRTFAWPTAFQGVTPVTLAPLGCTSEFFNVTNTTGLGVQIIADNYNSQFGNSSVAPSAQGAAYRGFFAIPTGTNPTLTVNTTAVGAQSVILLQADQSIGGALNPTVTCNTSAPSELVVTARTPGTGFVAEAAGTVTTNPVCVSFTVVNP